MDVEDEAFKGKKREKRLDFYGARLKAWAFGALLQLELSFFLICLIFSFQLIFWVSLPFPLITALADSPKKKKKKKNSPFWLLDVTGNCVNVLLIIISFICIFIYIVSLWGLLIRVIL